MENFKTDTANSSGSPVVDNAATASKSQFSGHQHSRLFKWIVGTLLELIIVLGVFALGVQVGFHKAGFTYSWINNYPNNFGGSRPPVKLPSSSEFLNAHGLFGTILSTGQNTLIVKDDDNNEKTVVVPANAVLRENFQDIHSSDLKTGQQIIVIGSPDNQGRIDAKFIRVLN